MTVPSNISAALATLKTYIEGLQDPFAATQLGQTYALWEIALNGTGGGGGGGDVSVISSVLPTGASTSALQSNVQADAGVDATKAIAIQGISDGQPVIFSAAHVKYVESQLTAPSSTVSRNMDGYSKLAVQVVVANINTNVVLRIEGSNDNSNWLNLSASNTDTTINANGVYGFTFIGAFQHVRTTFVSESGGTSATIDVITRLSA